MHEGSVSVIILIMLVLIGIITYYIYDYYKYKTDVSAHFDKTNKRVDTERTERLGNVKSIVDQVNVAHDSMHDEFKRVEDSINTLDNNINTLDNNINNIEGGINKVMSFTDDSGNSIGLRYLNLPGSSEPNMNLLKNVNVLGGMTIKDLDKASKNKMKMCSKDDPSKCIQIPDDNGNVYLTNLYKDSAIALDGTTIVNAPLSFTEAGKLGARITGNQDGTGFMETNAFGIGSTKMTPTASLHVMTPGGTNSVAPFKVTVNNKDVLNVDQNGTLHTTRIELKPADSANTTAILQAVSDGVMIDAPNVYTSGNLRVNGVVYQSAAGAAETARLLAGSTSTSHSTGTTGTTGTAGTAGTANTTGTVSTFTSGPINTKRTISSFMNGPNTSSYTMKPADYMNAPYLITVQ